ncbi:preprotein translocase subunit SecA [Gemmata obscuriglobus]|uniref:Protein translocase subunit SecA n=1 Tax=Gemmata obscuriglobus TaxID=114 RepID=A0A2Z3HBC0_9BACT|nr:preprotein translocase subunit SecA [Gemmata obscuriglobus]AWM40827.1 preprotein translocase subunit SecA [Gemmata obscuriglobus]QEG25887.1 preprotein translocase subunit SecA [Gemmata obscuriglobus]VTR99939.1 preprotein translocase subunit : Protein translocase subunit SecA OS=uncultured planctomycete GN=secA PE=3 SV=1: SecA_DEAD: SecA_PP_bind [Gemmata obscuriglobus UQM 2246]
MGAVELPHEAPRKIENTPGRLGSWSVNSAVSRVGTPWTRRLAKAALMIPKIRYYEKLHADVSDEKLIELSMELRGKARGKWDLDALLPEAFGLVSVSIQRTLNIRPFDVQLAAGTVMHFGGLVELSTGEGKTVSASAPAYLNALSGKGVHVTTVNDYLAKRDAEWIGPVYQKLGMSVGVLQQKMDESARVTAYKADITYGTAAEFGFDFLRDRLKLRGGQANAAPFWAAWTGGAGRLDPRVQRPLHYAIVDEADSIFVDEAKTPLIIANPTRAAEPDEQVVFKWADQLAREMRRDQHFVMNAKKDKIELTDAGKHLVRYSNPPTGKHAKAMDKLLEAVERGLQAHYRFMRDQHYMVNGEKKIVIIDEGTGRPMPDRHWRDGLHQAVEAKEQVQINMPSSHAAQITFQNFYRLYTKLAGMSGTLLPNFWEMRKVYRRWTTKVPTNKPNRRDNLPDLVFPTEEAKFDAVVRKTQEMLAVGRPVLIGTRTVEASKKISAKLTAVGVAHQVLNAEQNENEAEVVAAAGQPGRVTVATNMAGRGTDIKLGPGVAEKGGLHVIGTERHEAERIDRQLVGRAGRQGDPGSAQFMLSLEDQLLEGLGVAKQRELEQLGKAGGSRDWNAYAPLFRQAQKRVEARHYRQRLDLMNYDKQRQEMLQDLGADPYVD